MCTSLLRWPRRLAAQARQRVAQRLARARDEGFVLLESIIAISLITVIMGAIGSEYVAGLASTSRQRATQVAAQLADSALEQVRALSPTDLVKNHDTASVSAEFSTAPAAVQPWLANMTQATDPTSPAGSGATAAIPTVGVIQQPGTQAYTVTYYLGWCGLKPFGLSWDCVKPSVDYLRAVAAVTWTSSTCPAAGCAYITATLISTASDPVFKVNLPPTVATPVNQTDSVGGTPTLVVNSTCPNGPCTYTLNGGPPGVTLNSSGAAVGTVGESAMPTYSGVTVTVADQAGAAATSGAFTWTVKAAPTLSGMPGENTPLGVTASPSYPIDFTCPNAPCTIALTGTVPGLGLSTTPVGINPTTPTTGNNTAISLTVTAARGAVYLNGTIQASAVPATATGCDGRCTNYSPQLTITDSSNVATATSGTTWHANTASYYTVSSPDGLTTARRATPDQPLSYACPDACTLSVTGQPSGIGLTTDPAGAGSPSVTLSGAGTVYLRGRVSASATQTTYLVRLSLTNSIGRVLDSAGNWVVQ